MLLLLAATCVTLVSQAAEEELLSSVNWARQHGCHVTAARTALQGNSKLQRAAQRLARGAALHDALAAEGYVASESSALHFSGAMSPSEIAHALTSQYCQTLTDPNLREFAMQRRGREVWVLLAAPVAAPVAADAAAVRGRILELVNAARAAGRRCGARFFAPAMPLTLNSRLSNAALEHSQEMAKYGEFDHRGHDGSTPEVRVERAGYGSYRIIGENIAAGAMTPAEVMEGWLASPAHCENIMDGRFTQIGIAFAANLKSVSGMYWTQDFAAPR